MKILLVAPQPFYVERGTPIAVRLLVQTLCDLGHEVDLLVYHEGRDIQVKGLTVIRARRPPGITSVPIGISVKKLVCDVFLVWRMIGLLRRKRYDVVHAVEEAIFAGAFLRPFLHRYRLVYDMDSSMADQVVEKWDRTQAGASRHGDLRARRREALGRGARRLRRPRRESAPLGTCRKGGGAARRADGRRAGARCVHAVAAPARARPQRAVARGGRQPGRAGALRGQPRVLPGHRPAAREPGPRAARARRAHGADRWQRGARAALSPTGCAARHRRPRAPAGSAAAGAARHIPGAGGHPAVATHARPEHADEDLFLHAGGQGNPRHRHPLAYAGARCGLRRARRCRAARLCRRVHESRARPPRGASASGMPPTPRPSANTRCRCTWRSCAACTRGSSRASRIAPRGSEAAGQRGAGINPCDAYQRTVRSILRACARAVHSR